jgi:hypothetical protein
MNILIEGERYPLNLLKEIFEDTKFYNEIGLDGSITSVGYYHSFKKNKLVFMLPKVFMRDGINTVLNCDKNDLIDLINNISVKHKTEFNWLRQLSVYFYNSLLEYRRRFNNNQIINKTQTFELRSNINFKDYSYLDILLNFIDFYKKNKQLILFKYIEFISDKVKKTKWEKTIRKSLPVLLTDGTPFYTEISNRKKVINNEDDIIIYFTSILHHLNKEHHLNLKIDKTIPIIKDEAFALLTKNGLSKLKKIKYRYFSDLLKRMYVLCEIYFSQVDTSSVKREKEDYMTINNYNIVFEDMVDKLLSGEHKNSDVQSISIEKLKYHEDGKILDHVFGYTSLFDKSDVFYIGDSKYYKSDNKPGKQSKYKQLTYAKNVIQINIDLLNELKEKEIFSFRYRDPLTEGYNISPNFFIYGYIDKINDFDSHCITKKYDPIKSDHYKGRLFDRDTLFVHQYQINFLFILKAYTTFNNISTENFKNEVKAEIRTNFLKYFNNKHECGYSFYESILPQENHEKFVTDHFKRLTGKIYKTSENKLLLAKHESDNTINDLLTSFTEFKINMH